MQTITAGTAVVSVDGLERTLATGERIEIAANQRFMFINRGRREWRFSARHPMWEPNTFFYEIDGREIPGDGLWFELKSSAKDAARRPMYRILSQEGRGTFSIAVVEPGVQTIRQRNTDGPNIVSVLAGRVALATGPAAAAAPAEMPRGAASRVAMNDPFVVANPSRAAAVVEIRPDPHASGIPRPHSGS